MAGCVSDCKTKPFLEPEGGMPGESSMQNEDKGKDPLDGNDPWTVVSGQFGSVRPLGGLGPAPKSPRPTEVFNRYEDLQETDNSAEDERLLAEFHALENYGDEILKHLEAQYEQLPDGSWKSHAKAKRRALTYWAKRIL